MSLKATKALADKVRAEAEASFPEECCGLLIGKVPERFDSFTREVVVDEVRPLPNGWEAGDARKRRYQIDPKVLAKAELELGGTGRGIVGFYHSHPDVPAWPSPFDLERAWPCYSYWIVEVRGGKAQGSRSWIRTDDGRSFQEESYNESR